MEVVKLLNFKKWQQLQLYCMILLIICSIIIGIQAPLLTKNLSYIGNSLRYRGLFVLWGTLSGIHFFISFMTLAHCSKMIIKRFQVYCFVACLLMVLSTIVPYYDDKMPFFSFLHLCAAMGGTSIYVVCYYYILLHYQYIDVTFCKKASLGYMIILLSCVLVIMTYASINTCSEIMFTILLPLFQYYVLIKQVKIK